MGLQAADHHLVHNYSGGMIRKLEIAQSVPWRSRHTPNDLTNSVWQHDATGRIKCLQNHHCHVPPPAYP